MQRDGLVVRVDNHPQMSSLVCGDLLTIHPRHVLEAATQLDADRFVRAVHETTLAGGADAVRVVAKRWREARLESGEGVAALPNAVCLLGDGPL